MHVTAIGRTKMLYNGIEAVREAGHEVERIVTCEAEDFYRVSESDFERLAEDIDADFAVRETINDDATVEMFEHSKSDVAISANWLTLIEQRTLDAFRHGILNAHAGDLPRYRGNAAPNWAIIAGEDEVVLTVHRMTTELDAGPIFTQRRVPITSETYLGDVYDAMWTDFPEMFAETVTELERGTADPEPQPDDPETVVRGLPRIPKDSELDWTRPAEQLHRVVRASAEPLFGAFTYLGTEKLRVWRAHVERPRKTYLGTPGQVAERRPDSGNVAVVTGENLLVLEEVEPEDGTRQPATDVISSIRTRLGMDYQSRIRSLERRVAELESEGETGDE